MPDITKCNDKECPLKDKCYRYWSKADEYQSYFVESPRDGDKCEHYWERQPYKVDDSNVNPIRLKEKK